MGARTVATSLKLDDRGCLFCLRKDGPFAGREHAIPRRLGSDTDRFVLDGDAVCDPCNNFLGRQVDAPFTNRFDISLTRGIEGLDDRHGSLLKMIDGRSVTSQLEIKCGDGPAVTVLASEVEHTPDGGFEAVIRPLHRDPPDIVARTLRALWKIGLGCIYGAQGRDAALSPRWDDTRRVILGAPFRGYLLEAPFTVRATRRLHVAVDTEDPAGPEAIQFLLGGVALAAPLVPGGAAQNRVALRERGWRLRHTSERADPYVRLRLTPD